MATRAIVTSPPVISCDVCGRRLLRGETPDVFLAGGRRRTVCELCVPRAAAEGWLREADDHASSVRPARQRRAGSLLGRFRQLREPDGGAQRLDSGRSRRRKPIEDAGALHEAGDPLYDFLDDDEVLQSVQGAAQPLHVEDSSMPEGSEPAVEGWAQPPVEEIPRTSGELKAERALEVFNASETTQRVAGIARSLGAPEICVCPLEGSGATVAIVVAWELCWYRWEIDLGDEAAGPRLAAEGMELDELPPRDREVNAVADERGTLALLGA